MVTTTKPKSVNPSCRSPNTMYSVPAASSSKNIGSRTVSIAIDSSERCWPPGSALGPSSAKRCAAWAADSPD
jgi:hypothetical protein